MPYLLPSAAPRGCRVTKKAKKRATAVFMAPLSSPISAVKCADSAFPIYRRQYRRLPKEFGAYIGLVKRVEEKQECQKREQQAIELQQCSLV
jgi:hypothetical protein